MKADFVFFHRAFFVGCIVLAFLSGCEPPQAGAYTPRPAGPETAVLAVSAISGGMSGGATVDLMSAGDPLEDTLLLVAGSRLAITGEGADADEIRALCPANDRGRLECKFGDLEGVSMNVSGRISFVRADFYQGNTPYYLEHIPP